MAAKPLFCPTLDRTLDPPLEFVIFSTYIIDRINLSTCRNEEQILIAFNKYFTEPTCDVQVDLCFIVDSSGSIRDNNPPGGQPDNWQLQLEFLSRLVDLFTIGPDATKVGAVVFSENVRLVFSLDTYTDAQSIKDAILGLAYLGQTTNTPKGLRITREQCFNQANGDRPNVQNLAIFISDGVPFPPERKDLAITEAEALRGVATVIAIGVTDVIDRDLLQTISSSPQEENRNWFVAVDFSELDVIRRSVGEGTCEVVAGIRIVYMYQIFAHFLHSH